MKNKNRSINSIKNLIENRTSVDKLMIYIKNWLNDMPKERRENYQELENYYNKILEQNSFDYSSFQALIDYIFELDDKNKETQMIK